MNLLPASVSEGTWLASPSGLFKATRGFFGSPPSQGLHLSTVYPPDEELTDGSHEAIRALDVWHVAAVRDEGERAFLQTRNRDTRLGFREHPVSGSPHDERRDLQGRETVHQHLALA